jgi:hypothetical protein
MIVTLNDKNDRHDRKKRRPGEKSCKYAWHRALNVDGATIAIFPGRIDT